jgi:hypothetical protein
MIVAALNRTLCVRTNKELSFFRTVQASGLCMHRMWVHGAVCGLVAVNVGSSPLLVIQVHGSKIATSKERVANWKILVNQWSNKHSFRD